ncbi:MAG: glycosyltransferase family 4 protein [Desulfobaccales bacterium]
MTEKNFKGIIAYGLAPHEGGTTTVYRNFARGLRALGWKVASVAVGKDAAHACDPRFGDEFSQMLAPEETSLGAQVEAFLTWVEQEAVDIVIPNCEANIIAAVPHLPSRVRYLSICHTTVRSAYLTSALYLNRLSQVVAISPQQVVELQRRWKVPQVKVRLIPHGIDTEPFDQRQVIKNQTGPLRLIFLGRLADMDKGVLWLPGILKGAEAQGAEFICDIVGSGPDREKLQAAMSRNGLSGKVRFHGQKPPGDIPGLLSQADGFLMTSRFEGLPMSLLEAMAAGCVPVVSRLHGITDVIVEEGASGFLCPMGKTGAFAEKIAFLHQNRDRLAEMSAAARRRVTARFSLERMAADYDRLFTETLACPPLPYTPRPLKQLQYPKELLPTWRTWVPQPLKNLARTWVYRACRRMI